MIQRRSTHRYKVGVGLSGKDKLRWFRNHPARLESMQELAILYKEQARYVEAEPLLRRTLEGPRLKLGDKHPHMQQSLNNLIKLYEAWNKPEKAEEWRAKLPMDVAENK